MPVRTEDYRPATARQAHQAADAGAAGRQGPTLRGRLTLFALAVALPLLALAGGAVWQQSRAERARAEEALVARTHAMALLLDREFAGAERVLRVLAAAEVLEPGDPAATWARMRAAATASGARAINLIGPDGRIRLSTSWPPGERDDTPSVGPARQALATGRTTVGNLYVSPTVAERAVALSLPVLLPGDGPAQVSHVLGFVMPRDRLVAALTEQRLPPGAIAVVLDRERTIVARTLRDAETVGTTAPNVLRTAVGQDTGMVPFAWTSLDGMRVVGAYALAPQTGYLVGVMVPEAAFEAPLRAALWSTALVGAVLLAASLLLGAAYARGIAGSLQRLASADGAGPTGRRPLREVGALAQALARNAAERDRAVAELRGLFDGSPVGVVRCDAGGRVQDANDAFLRIIGMTRADLSAGRVRWDDLTPPEWIGRDEAAIAEAVRLGSCAPYQKEYIRADGSHVAVLVFFAFQDRNAGAMAAFVVDLSGWTATEAALLRVHEQMRLAIGAARMFFWDWNLQDGTVEWSAGLEAACRMPPGSFGGTADAFRALVHPADLPHVEAALARALAGEAEYDTEFRMRCGDGGVRWVVARGTVLRDGAGRPVRMVGIDFDVTQRKAAEEALAEGEARLRAAQAVGRVGVWDWDLATGRTACSAEYLRIYGLPPDAPMPSYADWLARVHPEDRAAADAAAQGGLAMGEYDDEFRILRPDGEVRRIAARGVVQGEADGGPARFIGVNIDVTARYADGIPQAGSGSGFRHLAEAMPAFVFVTDAEGRNTFTNGRFQDYAGLPAAALAGDGWLAVLHPDDRARAAEVWGRAVATGASYQAEYRFRRARDGALRWFLVRGEPERDREGRIRRWIGTCTDVDDLRRTEAALLAAEERLRLALEAAELGTWSWDLRDGAIEMSARCRALYGITADTLLDYDWLLAVLHPDDRAATDMAIVQAVADGTEYDVEHRVLLGPHEVRWRRARGRASFGPSGAAVRLRGVAMDIDAQKRAAAALQADNARLEARVAERTQALSLAATELTAEMRRREEVQAALLQAQKLEALGQLTGGVAHDFNNVLAAIIGSLRLIARRAEEPSEIADLARSGQRAAERAVALIRQLLAFARREELAPTTLRPATLLDEAEDLVRHAVGTGVGLTTECEAGTWHVLADLHRLEVALLNLAVNARDAMAGQGRLSITARNAPGGAADGGTPPELRAAADHVVIAVRDSGPGMPPAVLARATEPFFTTKPEGKGTGLGLAMVHGFMHQSGGALRILSVQGEGTTVELWLPRAAEASGPTADDEGDDAAPHGGATILVVDSSNTLRLVTATWLRELGYEVLEANGPEAALVQALATDRLDLVVTEVSLPGGDGLALAERLRVERPDLPVLFVSGNADRYGLATEVVLTKPFTAAELATRVLAALRRRPGRDRLLGRLRHADLREAYLTWRRRYRVAGGGPCLPWLDEAEVAVLSGAPHAFIVAVEADATEGAALRYLHLGPALASRLGSQADGMPIEMGPDTDEVFAGLPEVYRRCVRLGVPCYDYARFGAADGAEPVLLERLLLPLALDGGTTPTHLLGLAVYSGPA